jgi:hypothetical protein
MILVYSRTVYKTAAVVATTAVTVVATTAEATTQK